MEIAAMNPAQRVLCGRIGDVLGQLDWSLWTRKEECSTLSWVLASSDAPESTSAHFAVNETIGARIAETGEIIFVTDVALDPKYVGLTDLLRKLNLESVACLPIRLGGEVLGLFQGIGTMTNLPSAEAITLAQWLCEDLTFLMKGEASTC